MARNSETTRVRCDAKSKQSGKRCKKSAVPEMTKCEIHGGKSLKGFEHPNYKHGKYSAYLNYVPESRRKSFDELMDESNLPSVSEEVALARLHERELLQMLGDSTFFDNWKAIRRQCEVLEEIILRPDEFDELGFGFEETPEMILQNIRELFIKSENLKNTWEQIHNVGERIRKMEDTRSKIRLNILEEQTERKELVPVEWFKNFASIVAKQFDLSPEHIRKMQMIGLQEAYNALPATIRQPKQLTDGK